MQGLMLGGYMLLVLMATPRPAQVTYLKNLRIYLREQLRCMLFL
jgi:hypothetical protein